MSVDMIHQSENLFALQARCLTSNAAGAAREIDRLGLWEYVASEACIHQVGGALIHALRERGIVIPASAAGQLDAFAEHVAAANTFSISRMSHIFARLLAAEVPFLVLKGAALNATVYPAAGLRGMADVDVLIRPEDAERVDGLLIDAGCCRGPDLVQDDFYPRYYYEREYLTPTVPAVKIDLHVRPFRPMRYGQTIGPEALWDDPMGVEIGSCQVQIPNPENMLILLCAHAAFHGLTELKWLYDIKVWLERYGATMDLKAVGAKCRRWGLSAVVRAALEKTLVVFAEPSAVLIKAIHRIEGRAKLLDRLVLWQAPRDEAHPIAHVLVNALCTPGVLHRLGYLAAVLAPGKHHLGQLYEGRHVGWPVVAHLVRVGRAMAKPFTAAPTSA